MKKRTLTDRLNRKKAHEMLSRNRKRYIREFLTLSCVMFGLMVVWYLILSFDYSFKEINEPVRLIIIPLLSTVIILLGIANFISYRKKFKSTLEFIENDK